MTKVMSPTLGAVISISKGKKHDISESPSRTAKRLIGIDDLRNDDLIRYTEDSNGVEAIPDDVLIAWDGANAGTIGFGKSGYIGSTIARLRLNDGIRLFTPFLGLYLKSKFDFLRQTATGATIPHIKRSALESIPLPKIDFNDQIRTAHLLGKVEGLIAQRKQHLQQLDDLLKSVFLEMFGDPVRNERAWPTKDLDSFIDQNRGISYGIVQRGDNFPGGIPVLRIRDVIAEEYIEEDLVRTDPSNSNRYARTILQGGELLLSIRGTVGAISVAPPQSVGWNVSRELAVIPVSNGVSKMYLAHLLKSPPMQRQFSSMIKGVAQSGLNLSDIRRIGVILPPAELQASYEQIAKKVESQVRVYRNSLADLEGLYGALSQQAFKGELDLSRVALPTVPIEGGVPVAAALPAPITAPVIELPETDLLLPALQDRTQLAPLLRFWLEAYRTQLGGAAFSLERFIAAAQTRFEELHPDYDFELAASDYESIKTWVFEALAAGVLMQAFDDDGNRIELKAVDEQSLA